MRLPDYKDGGFNIVSDNLKGVRVVAGVDLTEEKYRFKV